MITANKGNVGHIFCGAGSVESVFSILSIKHGIIPKILNLENPCDKDLNFAMSNV